MEWSFTSFPALNFVTSNKTQPRHEKRPLPQYHPLSWIVDNKTATTKEAWSQDVFLGQAGLLQPGQSLRFLALPDPWNRALDAPRTLKIIFCKQGCAPIVVPMVCALQRTNLQVPRVCTCSQCCQTPAKCPSTWWWSRGCQRLHWKIFVKLVPAHLSHSPVPVLLTQGPTQQPSESTPRDLVGAISTCVHGNRTHEDQSVYSEAIPLSQCHHT